MEILSSIRALIDRPASESEPLGLRTMNPENPSTPLGAIAKWLGSGNQTVSGEQINETIALQIVTVYACARVLAESVGSMRCVTYEYTKLGREEAPHHPLHDLLSSEPNPEMSAVTFWEAMVAASALTGNAYAHIVRDKGGDIAELYPLHPLATEPWRMPDGRLMYRTTQGQKSGQWLYIDMADVLHFPLFSFDGLRGLSPIQQARQSLGLTRAAEKFGAKWFANGSKPGGILTGPPGLTPDQKVQAKENWESTQGGSNQGRTAVMPGEWKYESIGLSPEDSQFIQTRQMQRTEIAALFRVPIHMVGDTSKISNSSYEQMALSFVQDTLRPILSRIEAECNRKLFSKLGSKAGKFFCAFDETERLRGDSATMARVIALGRQWGLMTANEGRKMLGLNPVNDPSMDAFLMPVNMTNQEQIIKEADDLNAMEQPLIAPGKDENDAANPDE